jgi:CRP-like cAMP-binding protein
MPPINLERVLELTLFSGLSQPDVCIICRKARLLTSTAGSFFFYQEDPADRIFLLLEGRVKLAQTTQEGDQVLMQVIAPYNIFGAVAINPGAIYPVSAEASAESEAIFWTQAEMLAFFQVHPQMALNAIKMMSQHALDFQERFRQLATERVERRLAHTLLRLASQTGRKLPEGVLINIPLTRQDLAEMIGATLFTVSRILKHWEDLGIIISKREQIIIRFPHGLVAIAEALPTGSP